MNTIVSDEPMNFFEGVTPGIFIGAEGIQQIQLTTEGRENGNLGAFAP
jgi:hypothetical protein